MSDDEGDVDDEPEVFMDEEKNEAARKAREDRQVKLRKMMEDGELESRCARGIIDVFLDEDMPDAPAEAESQPTATSTDTVESEDLAQAEPSVTVENGRRRGRRRVMKKKKVKDEDGYLGRQTLRTVFVRN
jgi:DNA polymerase delta subunit 3